VIYPIGEKNDEITRLAMIISHKNQFIFIRVPKTASTSIEIELSKICGPMDLITPVSFKNDPQNIVDDYKKPQKLKRDFRTFNASDWLRIILRRKPVNYKHAHAIQVRKLVGKDVWDHYFKFCFVRNPFDRAISLYYWTSKNWQNKYQNTLPEINDYILSLPETTLSTWKRYTIGNKVAMDLIGRYEKLDEDLAFIEQKIGIPHLIISHAKSSIRKDRRPYRDVINPAARAHIETACSLEIAAFGYEWDSL
jgi:hypothetical protein